MKRTPRTALSLLFAALALAATVACVGMPWVEAETPVQVAQSTSAILEGRAA